MMASSPESYQDFLEMGVNQLKEYLSMKGISVSGYSKVELVARAFSAAEMNLPVLLSNEETVMRLDADYTKRLRDFDLDDPKKYEKSNKKNDIPLWPKIMLGNIC